MWARGGKRATFFQRRFRCETALLREEKIDFRLRPPVEDYKSASGFNWPPEQIWPSLNLTRGETEAVEFTQFVLRIGKLRVGIWRPREAGLTALRSRSDTANSNFISMHYGPTDRPFARRQIASDPPLQGSP